jgi:hypothetical protein
MSASCEAFPVAVLTRVGWTSAASLFQQELDVLGDGEFLVGGHHAHRDSGAVG